PASWLGGSPTSNSCSPLRWSMTPISCFFSGSIVEDLGVQRSQHIDNKEKNDAARDKQLLLGTGTDMGPFPQHTLRKPPRLRTDVHAGLCRAAWTMQV